jgi:D-alanyl-lipoteichoic acid acyltransferase DltB (MBOAT superfamily)
LSDLVTVIASIVVNFVIANLPFLSPRIKMALCVTIDVGHIVFLKYTAATGLFQSSAQVGNLFGVVGPPLGIPFVTFRQIMFVVDQAEGRDRESPFILFSALAGVV